MKDKLYETIVDVVYEHLADWGCIARIDQWEDQKNKPLRELLNELCDPLIEELYKEISNLEGEEK